MRNEDIITAISAKIAAAISRATGTEVPVIPAAAWAARSDESFAYCPLLTDDVRAMLSPDPWGPFGLGGVMEAMTHLSLFAQFSSHPVEWFTFPPAPDGVTPEEWATQAEDEELARIPREYWPDSPAGPRTDKREAEAREVLDLAFGHSLGTEDRPWRREDLQARTEEIALQFVPTEFQPEGEGAAAEAERRLAGWTALQNQRNALVRAALDAGVTKTRIQEITGISRSTINRMPA